MDTCLCIHTCVFTYIYMINHMFTFWLSFRKFKMIYSRLFSG